MMTLEEAKLILKTYKMPMTSEQIVIYRQALNRVMRSIWGLS